MVQVTLYKLSCSMSVRKNDQKVQSLWSLFLYPMQPEEDTHPACMVVK